MNNSIYYYYKLDVPRSNRIYTIEFECKKKDKVELILKKTLSIAKDMFNYLNSEFQKLNELIACDLEKKRMEIKQTQKLSFAQYSELLDQFTIYEKKQCEQFKAETYMDEFERLQNILSNGTQALLKLKSPDITRSGSTHYSTQHRSGIVLLKVFERSTRKGILDHTLKKKNIVPEFPVNSETFILETFEKFAMQSQDLW